MKIILHGGINQKQKQTTKKAMRKWHMGHFSPKPMDKLSLGFEAAKYKASIKSSPVGSNNVS